MQLFWLLLGLLVAVNAAVPDGSRRLGQTVDCSGPVVFSALTTPKTKASAQQNKVAVFETSLIDKSIGYSRERGIFTTHCPGLYQFSFTVTGDANSKFSFRKRASSSATSWNSIVDTEKTGGSYTLFLNMEVGEEAAIFINDGSLSAATSHIFSGQRVARK